MEKLLTQQYWKDEFRSILVTFLASYPAFFVLEAYDLLVSLYNGEFTGALFYALVFAMGRAAFKAILTSIFPSLFPPRTSKPDQNGTTSN